jgi:cytidyltransferase-like protein
MAIVELDELKKIRETNSNKSIIYCSGTFDIFHAGHVLFLKECSDLGECLVVGVGCDEAVKRLKGPTRPVINERLRIEVINSIGVVDYCFIDRQLGVKPLDGLDVILEALRPTVYVVNEDGYDLEARRKIAEVTDVEFKVLKRKAPASFDGISTTAIIDKISNINSQRLCLKWKLKK